LIILAGLSGGAALGCKTTYLVLVFFLVIVACALEWVAGKSAPGRMRRSLCGGLVFGTAALACSAFWFVRGAVQAGNPIYPLGVSVAGKEILPGFSDDDWFPHRSLATKVQRWWHYPWTEPKYAGSGETYSVNNGLGAAYAAFVPIGLVFAVLLVMKERSRRVEDRWFGVYATLVLAGVALLLTVFEEVLRYVLGPVLLAIPVSALLYQRLQIRFPRAIAVVVNVSLLVTVAVAALPPARALASRVRDGSWSRRSFYSIPDVVNLLPSGTRVLNLAPPHNTYALYGLRLANDVIPGTLWNTLVEDGEVTAANLDAHRIEYVFLRQPPSGRPWPDERWPRDLPVQCIYDDSPYLTDHPIPASRLYRVNTTALAARSAR